MAVSAVVKDGEIQQTAAETSAKKATKSNSGMDKDAFLQLLVAQMKYQDPLEPTSNTEYISTQNCLTHGSASRNISDEEWCCHAPYHPVCPIVDRPVLWERSSTLWVSCSGKCEEVLNHSSNCRKSSFNYVFCLTTK